MQINAIKMVMSIIYFKGSQGKCPNYVVLQSPLIVFILENNADLVKCRVLWHFIRVCAVFFQGTRLGVSSIQKG